MIRYFLIALLTILTCITNVQADDNADHIELLSNHYKLQKPDGEGPFPAVMLVPGCTGFLSNQLKHYDIVQNELIKLGFVTLRVDYLAARNISSCVDLPSTFAGGDICIAAEYLNQQTFVKRGAINVIGWSYGGAAVLRALRRTESMEPAQVDAAVTYYPYCFAARRWDSDVPVLVLMGTIDTVTPVSSCEQIFSRLPKRDKLTIRIYDNALHCFDYSDFPPVFETEFGMMGYNKAAAEAAWIEVTNFLKR